MSEPVNTKRPYKSRRREQQALKTREAILAAARSLFAERGYAATTIEAIAERADVAVPTIYFVFRSKRGILSTLLDVLLKQAALGETYRELMAETDPRRQLRLSVHITRRVMEEAGDLIDALRSAGSSDAEFRETWRELERGRRGGIEAFVRTLAQRGHLHLGLAETRATDIHWSMVSHELYHLLVAESGWAGDSYEEWLTDALAVLLLR